MVGAPVVRVLAVRFGPLVGHRIHRAASICTGATRLDELLNIRFVRGGASQRGPCVLLNIRFVRGRDLGCRRGFVKHSVRSGACLPCRMRSVSSSPGSFRVRPALPGPAEDARPGEATGVLLNIRFVRGGEINWFGLQEMATLGPGTTGRGPLGAEPTRNTIGDGDARRFRILRRTDGPAVGGRPVPPDVA